MRPQDFIKTNAALTAPPLVPEIKLYLATEVVPLWRATEEELAKIGVPPPYWAFAWAGGQALARYILDHPDMVAGKRVLDIGAGSGLVGLAAARAGAASVLAADIDAFACAAIRLNAIANDCEITVTRWVIQAATIFPKPESRSWPATASRPRAIWKTGKSAKPASTDWQAARMLWARRASPPLSQCRRS